MRNFDITNRECVATGAKVLPLSPVHSYNKSLKRQCVRLSLRLWYNDLGVVSLLNVPIIV